MPVETWSSAPLLGLNTQVFEQPGLPTADVVRLTELLGELRQAAGDHVAAAAYFTVVTWMSYYQLVGHPTIPV